VVLRWRKKESPLGLQVAGCIFAFCVSAYTGMLLSASVAVPLWNRAVLPLLFIASAACTGAAAMYLVVRFAEKDELGEAGALHKAMFWTAVCVAVLTTMLLVVANGATGQMQHAGTSAVASIVSGSFAPLFWVGIVALGMVVPIVGEGTRVLKARTSAEGTALVMAQCVSVLIGGFCLRYAIVCAAVSIGMLW